MGLAIALVLALVPIAIANMGPAWFAQTITQDPLKVCDASTEEDQPLPKETQVTPMPDGEKGAAIPYLGDSSYLRGVNMYDLEALRRIDTTCALNQPEASYTYLASRGVTIVRLAVPWERLQPVPDSGDYQEGMNAGLDKAYLEVVQTEVDRIAAAGMRVILDLHNGGTYPSGPGVRVPDTVAFGDGISVKQAQHIWGMLSQVFKNQTAIAAYDIFNEPSLSMMTADVYKKYTVAVVKAIRANGDQHTLWVEGMKEMTEGRLVQIAPKGPWISDPLDKIVYSQHFYPGGTGSTNAAFRADSDYVSFTQQMKDFGGWCQKYDVHCSVGEVGWPSMESQKLTSDNGDNWSTVGEGFYKLADTYKMDVTYFASTGGTKPGWLNAYTSSDGTAIDTARSQSSVIERHLTK
ncbi:glycoside hydrolase family 5 protein [Subtercola boreus]|nr:cellulase family glycosylhydrolase [Subtercola boreus]